MHGARRATHDDLEVLERILDTAVSETPLTRGGAWFGQPERRVPPRNRIHAALDDPAVLVVAGTADEIVFGLALARLEDSLVTIEEFHVERDAREIGIGEAMLDVTVDWARANNADGVDFSALPGDRATKNLGERSGFSARLIVMHRDLRSRS